MFFFFEIYFQKKRINTSPTPFSAHHSLRLVLKISPLTRKSNGTGLSSDKALLTSWESWYRFHVVGIIYFWVGSGYWLWVVRNTGCDVIVDDEEDAAAMVVDVKKIKNLKKLLT